VSDFGKSLGIIALKVERYNMKRRILWAVAGNYATGNSLLCRFEQMNVCYHHSEGDLICSK
jgi:hypothetical protein